MLACFVCMSGRDATVAILMVLYIRQNRIYGPISATRD